MLSKRQAPCSQGRARVPPRRGLKPAASCHKIARELAGSARGMERRG